MSLPVGKFVRVHSIRRNKEGTIDVVLMPRRKKRNPPRKKKAKRKNTKRKVKRNAKRTLKFGSPAWRKKYLKNRKTRKKRRANRRTRR